MPAECTYTMSYDVDHDVLNDFEAELDGLRRSIAMLSLDACGTVVDTFGSLGPSDLVLIDIDESEAAGPLPQRPSVLVF